jgi:hypothetical protein
MKRLHLIVLACVFLVLQKANAQAKMPNERLDSIHLSVVNFFKDKQYFEKSESVGKCLKTIYFNEMLTSRKLGDDQVGIYLTGVLISHLHRFVLIVNSDGWKIEKDGPISELDDMVTFFKRHHVKNKEIDCYLKVLLQIHEYNE